MGVLMIAFDMIVFDERQRKRGDTMTKQTSSWNGIMQYSFLAVFANDGRIDAAEMAFLEKLALRDGTVDAQERTVLSRIFAKVDQESVTPDVWAEILSFKERHGIP